MFLSFADFVGFVFMNLADWIDQRRSEWKQLDHLLDLVENSGLSSLNDEQAMEFARLYRRTASDLNQARTFLSAENTVQYLNDLIARSYMLIHARGNLHLGQLLKKFILGYPAHLRRHWKHLALATAIFALGAVFSFLASYFDGPVARSLLLPMDMPMIQPNQEGQLMTGGELSHLSSFYFTNNTRVCLIACALGLTFGIGTALLMWSTGLMVGALAAVFIEAGDLQGFLTGVLPHGVIEIPAVLIGGAAGFILAEAMIRARPWPRLVEMARAGREALWLLAGCFPLMFAAAFLEAIVARAPDAYLGAGLKLIVAALVGLTFLSYILLVGWGQKLTEET